MRYVMGDVRDVQEEREESERYDMCEIRDTKQNYIEILQSITYLLTE